MDRYTVTVVSAGKRISLAIPFSPASLVVTSQDKLAQRMLRQGIEFSPHAHDLTLHLERVDQALLDGSDTLDSVIEARTDTVFAVIAPRANQELTGLLNEEDNVELQTMFHSPGCYKFQPESLVNASAICEMEPFLSTSERPPVTPPTRTPRNRLESMGHF